MVALTSVSFVVLFACSWIFVLCQETQEVTVKPGENVTLQCQSHRDADIEVIKWIRTDLKSDDDFVFYFTPNQTNGEHQNSLFQGRVELQHPEKKDGDASVILENVTIKDTGTYECWIAVKNNTKRRKRDAPEPISTIELTVIGTQEVKVKPGEDATLPCQSHRDADIEVIKWIRPDLNTDGFVFYLSPDQINGEYQNSLFQGRVELQGPEKKNRDASVILKNVNSNDTGTYECLIAVKNNTRRRKREAPEPISTIKLTVTETQELKVKAGEDATLQCQSHRDADITVIKWIRPDLKSDGFVFYLSSDQINGEHQNSLFQGRVELQDPDKKDGDASLILKNVNINDAGTYECWIVVKNSGRRKREAAEPKPIRTIELTVTGHTAGDKEGGDKEGGDKKGNVGLMVGLTVFAVLLVAVVGTMLFKKRRGKTPLTGGETVALKSPTSG
ncbi:coxsackievirus and adenovirus receptor homolog isoform X2 [Micropterus salmoides]|uniref:coxsackievirus and adenovirus receptor homolog isoform X2 n=1 Tax=Micropterus salmoides TaxID=27706 RepID=UPI0018EB8C37|nr:coxsackievirus and adenovirus receptor homolog isoform X2 [Micropterus salmoides]XP_038586445.1 coxsackievirus and adenovirus receptor homolog isoform X2 [Micropterus salmoides]